MPRYYTPKQANEALAVVRPIMEEMIQIGGQIRAHQPELWALVERTAGNGGNPALGKILKDFDRLDALLHQIQGLGIQVKDLEIGLIDFFAWHDVSMKCFYVGNSARKACSTGTRSRPGLQAAN